MSVIDDELLRALYEGMFDQPWWSTFLDRLRARAGAQVAALAIGPIGQADAVELVSGAQPDAPFRALLSSRDMREGRVYAPDELLARAPADAGDVRVVRVTEPGGVDAWLGCAARRHGGAAAGALLGGLAPHLRTALRAFVALERERFRSAVTAETFRRLNFGWMTLDAQGRILDTSANVEELFQRSGLLRRGRYDRLTPASPVLDREIMALLGRFACDPEARPRPITVSRDPLLELLLRPIPARSPAGPVAIAYVSGDRLSQADRCGQLVDLFGLLPSEARLAWAIVQGMTIAEAATDLGLSIETARNYSKKIYAKTGARGQPELVRNILTSVLALA